MRSKESLALAESIIAGAVPDARACTALADVPDGEVFHLLAGADLIREHFFGGAIHICTICNGKSGRCSEDCTFCSQSVFSKTDVPVYPLLSGEELRKGARYAAESPVNRYSIVTSGKGLSRGEVAAVAEAIASMEHGKVGYCGSLGILGRDDFEILRKAGMTRYHHNLETSRSHFDRICSTHSYQERIDTIRAAREAGLSICSGGIFGIGETDEQVLELALTLKELEVDAVPVNFLIPIKGTSMEGRRELTPLRCLKIIALFRYVLPDKDILVCGGREANLQELHPLIFFAGASGIMTGNYLTTTGRAIDHDMRMLDHLNFTARKQ